VRNASPTVQGIIATAYRTLKQTPEFWTSHYLTRANTHPLPAHHPYAARLAQALAHSPHHRPTHAAGNLFAELGHLPANVEHAIAHALSERHRIPKQAAHGALNLARMVHAGNHEAIAKVHASSRTIQELVREALAHLRGVTHAAGAHGHGGGGGHHGGGRHHAHHGARRGGVAPVTRFREDEAELFGGAAWGGPFGYGSDYIILDDERMDRTPPGADNGGPEWDEAQHTARGLFEGRR